MRVLRSPTQSVGVVRGSHVKGGSLARLRATRATAKTNLPEKPVRYAKGASSRGVMYFDHKVPDEFSFPEKIAKGLIVKFDGSEEKANLIPKTIPPYRKKSTTKTQTSGEVEK